MTIYLINYNTAQNYGVEVTKNFDDAMELFAIRKQELKNEKPQNEHTIYQEDRTHFLVYEQCEDDTYEGQFYYVDFIEKEV